MNYLSTNNPWNNAYFHPEENVLVLGYLFRDRAYAVCFYAHDKWYLYLGQDDAMVELQGVTHWQLLPEPPGKSEI